MHFKFTAKGFTTYLRFRIIFIILIFFNAMILTLFFTSFLSSLVIIKYAFCFPDGGTGGSPVAGGPPSGNCGGGGGGTGAVGVFTPDMYPTPKRDEKIQDTYGKIIVPDPYRWMEKPPLDEIKKYYESENAVTRPYLDKNPFRADIKARYTELYNYSKYYGPFKYGNKYYSFQNTGLQNQDVFYVQDSLNCDPKIFLDPNALSKDGTIALNFETSSFSYDGLIFAYSLSQNGSDRMKVKFKHVEKGDIYKEELTEVRYTTLQWTRDNKGIFYGRFLGDNPDHESVQNQKLYYHVLGSDQSKDILVAEFPENPDYMIGGTNLSDCGKYLIITPSDNDDHNLVYVADLEKIKYQIKTKLELIPIVTKMEAEYKFIANNDNIFIFKTNIGADNYKLMTIDIGNPKSPWIDLVPESKTDVLDSAKAVAENYLILNYIDDVKNILQLHCIKTGKLVHKFSLEICSIDYITGARTQNEIFFKEITLLSPGIIYRCDLSKPCFEVQIFKEIKLQNFDRSQFTVEQVFYESKDKTQIPMYITYKKGLEKTGNNPAFLFGDGVFGDSLLPYFSPTRLLFIGNLNGVHAVANVRGGGERGKKWHDDGKLDKKQNSFDDFQAAAEYLIRQKFTSNKLLTINGDGQGGGLMTAVCLNQRPDLYGAVITQSGLYDMLRYNKFTEDGKTWVSEFGSSDNVKQFEFIFKYSPLHNIKIPEESDKQYPPTLITCADDDNKIPHASKFISTLHFLAKNRPNQKNPLLLKVGTNSGNGSYKPTEKEIEDNTDMMCFIVNAIGIKFHK